jgi:uncharacterized protein (DUF736 family)
MIIGTFTKSNNDLTGSISTFGAQFPEVTFEAITKNGNGPDFVIHANGSELGAAWKKVSQDGKKNYISVSFKGPLLTKDVYAAMFETKTPGSYALVWDELKKDEA